MKKYRCVKELPYLGEKKIDKGDIVRVECEMITNNGPSIICFEKSVAGELLMKLFKTDYFEEVKEPVIKPEVLEKLKPLLGQNLKFRVTPKQSEELQEFLFEQRVIWFDCLAPEILHLDKKFLEISKQKPSGWNIDGYNLSWLNEVEFKGSKNKEFNLKTGEIAKPKYRAFKDDEIEDERSNDIINALKECENCKSKDSKIAIDLSQLEKRDEEIERLEDQLSFTKGLIRNCNLQAKEQSEEIERLKKALGNVEVKDVQ